MLRSGQRRGIHFRLTRQGLCLLIQTDDTELMLRQPAEKGGIGDQHRRMTGLDHRRQPSYRQHWNQGQICPAGFHHRQQTDEQIRRALQKDRYHDIRSHPTLAQMMRQPIGLTIQFRIGPFAPFEQQADGIRRSADLRLEQLIKTPLAIYRPVGGIPLSQHPMLLLPGKYRHTP